MLIAIPIVGEITIAHHKKLQQIEIETDDAAEMEKFHVQVSISPTFKEQLLRPQIPKAQKDS